MRKIRSTSNDIEIAFNTWLYRTDTLTATYGMQNFNGVALTCDVEEF